MLDGWYCRSIADAAAAAEEEDRTQEESKLKKEYRILKRKFQYLIYENEAFQKALRTSQKRLLQITRDRSFLLDRLSLYEKGDNSTSESEDTESSDEGEPQKLEPCKKRRLEPASNLHLQGPSMVNSGKGVNVAKKKRPPPRPKQHPVLQSPLNIATSNSFLSDGHMTPEEVERHLQSRHGFMELIPERAPPTVPNEMFSNEPSLDSESNDVAELETSPSNMGEELSIDMIQE